MKIFHSFLLIILSIYFITAQSISRFNCEITVHDKILENAFAGGVNSAQFNSLDVDRDGKKDLIVYDRDGNKINVFLKQDDEANYSYAPQYNGIFPEVTGWMLLVDYNNDGLEDLFTGRNGGIEVWKSSLAGGTIKFEKYINPRNSEGLLSYKDSNYQIPLESNFIDIPAIADLDFDGDMDILSFPGSQNRIYYYKNLCSENNLSLDSFRFVLPETCWGKFVENSSNDSINLSPNPYDCADRLIAQSRHTGSTILAFDADADKDYDLLIGDTGSNKIKFIKNGGDKNHAWATEVDEEFPSYDKPVDLPTFVGVFHLDLDGDGNKDLIFSPNATYDVAFSQTINNVHFYKNKVSGTENRFEFVQKDFLTNTMIDLGGNVYPVFIDIDGDSLTDIVVGTGPTDENGIIFPSRLILFKNKGTKSKPSFELTDSDYLSFSKISKDLQINHFTPTFGDLDNDGDQDLLVGHDEGKIIYLQNISNGNNAMNFADPVYDYQYLDVISFSAPLIIDVNKDGLKDILLGSEQDYHTILHYYGSIVYFQNIGNQSNPVFNSDPFTAPNTPQFGNIVLSKAFQNKSNAYLSSYIDADDEYLFTGHFFGKINVYTDISESIYNTASPIYKDYGNINVGSNSTPTVADIDEDGYLEMLIGTPRGGFEFWNTDIKVKNGVGIEYIKNDINIYPNPFQSFINIDIDMDLEKGQKAMIYDIMGRKIYEENIDSHNNKINTEKLNIGTYFLKIKFSKKTIFYKIIKSTY